MRIAGGVGVLVALVLVSSCTFQVRKEDDQAGRACFAFTDAERNVAAGQTENAQLGLLEEATNFAQNAAKRDDRYEPLAQRLATLWGVVVDWHRYSSEEMTPHFERVREECNKLP